MTADTIIPTADLDMAHTALDLMLAAVPGRTADSIWIRVMDSVEDLPDDARRQNLALLLTVALQRLALTSDTPR